MHKDFEYWKSFFESCNSLFLQSNTNLILDNASERSICNSLSQIIHDNILQSEYKNYYVDTEYNRNDGKIKTILNDDSNVITINCDLIIHSRRNNIQQDNLLALEMKKSTRPAHEKESDKNRVKILTKESFDDVWSYDGKSFPEHVCRYIIGIYYEINISERIIYLEYYSTGKLIKCKNIKF